MAVVNQAVVVVAMYGLLLISAAQADVHSAAAAVAVPAPGPAVAVPAPAPAPTKPLTLHGKVVAALRAEGHYGAISGLLESLDEGAVIKEGITFFAPDDSAFEGLNMNSSRVLMTTLEYHVSTSVYNYQALSNLPLNSTIQTAVPNVVIFITSTGASGLRLDGIAISDPDIYHDGQVAVQGIGSIFNTAKYNNPGLVTPEAPPSAGTPAVAPGLITTPTTPKSSSPNAAARHDITSVARTVFLVALISFVIALRL